MKTFIYRSPDKAAYQNLLETYFPGADIYFDFNFLECDAALHHGTPEAFVSIDGDEILIYPYLRLPFAGQELSQYTDVISPYGYAGPITNTTQEDFLFKTEEALIQHLIDTNTVTEFIRYHFSSICFFKQNIVQELNRSIVVLPLQQDWEHIWMKEFSTSNRNVIRKMVKEGFQVEESEDEGALEAFVQLYTATMDNVKASSFYYFDLDFMKRLKGALKDKLRLFSVVKDGIVYSSSLFFFTNDIATYYLSARNLEYTKVPATNYLLAKVAEIAHNEGLKLFNLGGGTTGKAADSLLKFKKNFSINLGSFSIGKRIILPEIYKSIQQNFINAHGVETFEKRKHVLQFYRM